MADATQRPRPDFAVVQLSDAGRRMAGEAGTVGWANGRRHFTFRVGEAQEVERSYEWNALLRHEMYQGKPVFKEIVVEPEPPAPDAPEAENFKKDGE
jgi:hypothetical protein